VLALVVVGAAIWTSYGTWWEAVEGDFKSPTALRAPLSVVYGILPLGMLLVAFQYIAFLIEGVQGLLAGEAEAERAAILGQGNAELAAAVEETDTDPATVGSAGTTPTHLPHDDERHGRP
jgi:hypothetical protein